MFKFASGDISASEAAEWLGISIRHVHRLRNRMASGGLQATLPQKRSCPPTNKFSDEKRMRIIEALRTDLVGYGPKQAADILTTEYDLPVSRETIRKLLIAENLWRPRGKDGKGRTRVRRPRQSRSRFGELILADTSFHEWIPGLGQMGLVVLIDDATSRIVGLSFTPTETCMAYMQCFETYVQTNGLPEGLYADRHKALLRLRGDWQGDGIRFDSEFARALVELGVFPIPSFSPQSRGRVERAHQTLQDWLPKFLKRRRAFTLESATALLPGFIEDHNARFAKTPYIEGNAHKPCPDQWVLRRALSLHEHRKLSGSMVVAFRNRKFVLADTPASNAAIGRRVTVHTHTDGTITISFEGRDCPYTETPTRPVARRDADGNAASQGQPFSRFPDNEFASLEPQH